MATASARDVHQYREGSRVNQYGAIYGEHDGGYLAELNRNGVTLVELPITETLHEQFHQVLDELERRARRFAMELVTMHAAIVDEEGDLAAGLAYFAAVANAAGWDECQGSWSPCSRTDPAEWPASYSPGGVWITRTAPPSTR